MEEEVAWLGGDEAVATYLVSREMPRGTTEISRKYVGSLR